VDSVGVILLCVYKSCFFSCCMSCSVGTCWWNLSLSKRRATAPGSITDMRLGGASGGTEVKVAQSRRIGQRYYTHIITQPDSSWTKYCIERRHTHLSQQNARTYATHPCSSSRILLALCLSRVNISGDLSMIWRASMAAEDIMGGIEAEKQ